MRVTFGVEDHRRFLLVARRQAALALDRTGEINPKAVEQVDQEKQQSNTNQEKHRGHQVWAQRCAGESPDC